MLDAGTVQLGAAVLLIAFLAGAILAGRGRAVGRRYEVAATIPLSEISKRVWVALNILTPPLAFGLAALLPAVIYGTVLNLSFPGDTAIQLAALPAFVAGGLLALWSARHLGRFLVVEIARAKDHELITSGPYARIRHPTYTATILLALSPALLLLHVLLILNLVLVVVLATYRARLEERLLASEEGFGAEYRAYKMRTGRFLPRLLPSRRNP